jgi:hypothetical protein
MDSVQMPASSWQHLISLDISFNEVEDLPTTVATMAALLVTHLFCSKL